MSCEVLVITAIAQVDVVIIYEKDGVINGSRTGLKSRGIKGVWKGCHEEFLERWRRARG